VNTPPDHQHTLPPPDPPAPLLDGEHWRHSPLVVQVLVGIMIVIAVTVAAGLIAAAVLLGLRPSTPAGSQVLVFAELIALGLTACGLVIAVIALIRRADRLSEQMASLQQHTAIQAERAVSAPVENPPSDPNLLEIRRLLTEIRETLLLPEERRRQRFDALMENEIRARLAQAEKLANSNDFHRAREQLQLLLDRFGSNERVAALQAQIEKQAQAAQEMDLRHARDRIADLMSLNQWDQAEQLTRELAEKYPNTPEPTALFQHVCRERQLFEQRHRTRSHAEIQQYGRQRRWQEAAQGTREFIATFTSGPDTDALRAQLDTLEANAEIQIRQELEAKIKEHVSRQEYWDALAVTRRLIIDYPFSPQANVLRGQLPRLEELARGQKG